jgi:hypothetical protein
MLKRLALAASVAGAALAISVGTASATPGPTPDQGLTGACNMTNTNAEFGMFTIAANTPAAGNGFNGMIVAIINSFPQALQYQYCPAPQ